LLILSKMATIQSTKLPPSLWNLTQTCSFIQEQSWYMSINTDFENPKWLSSHKRILYKISLKCDFVQKNCWDLLIAANQLLVWYFSGSYKMVSVQFRLPHFHWRLYFYPTCINGPMNVFILSTIMIVIMFGIGRSQYTRYDKSDKLTMLGQISLITFLEEYIKVDLSFLVCYI